MVSFAASSFLAYSRFQRYSPCSLMTPLAIRRRRCSSWGRLANSFSRRCASRISRSVSSISISSTLDGIDRGDNAGAVTNGDLHVGLGLDLPPRVHLASFLERAAHGL